MNLKTYYNLQSTQAIFFIKHTSSLGREEASSSFNTMVEYMLKSSRLPDYRFPYAIFVLKLIDYFEVDTTNERNDTIKATGEIDNSTLLKMGFQKKDDSWVFRRNAANRAENQAADPENEEENADGVQNMDASPVHSAEHEDVAATSQNAMVTYEEPEYRGEPLSMFAGQVLSRLDTLTYE